MYAIIVTGGKQYKVTDGDVVFVEKLDAEENAEITFDKVLAVGSDDGIKTGAPYVEGATVAAKVIKNGKSKKVTVFTYKSKKTRSVKWVTVSLTPRLRLPQLTHNDNRKILPVG